MSACRFKIGIRCHALAMFSKPSSWHSLSIGQAHQQPAWCCSKYCYMPMHRGMLTASLRPAGAKLGTKRPRMTENGEVLVARQQKMKLHSSQDLLQVAQRGQPGSLGARSVL